MSSWSPKKYRKNGSLANGEFGVRVTWIDEMFATPLTAAAATLVKSGPPDRHATSGRAVIGAARSRLGGLSRCRFNGLSRLGIAERAGHAVHAAGDHQAGGEAGNQEHGREQEAAEHEGRQTLPGV